MSIPIYQRVAQTGAGAIIPSAEYTVINENTGLDFPIYSDRAGTTLKSAPYFADANGVVQFYIAAGTTFRVAATGGVGTYTDRYVYAAYAQESATDATAGRLMSVESLVLLNGDMFGDGAGSVGIGTSSPDLSDFTAAATGLHIKGLAPAIRLEDTSGENSIIGQLNENLYINNKAAGSIRLYTSSTEAMRIDSSRNLLVGKAVTDANVSGSILNADGTVLFTASGAKVVNVNRTGTDGTAVGFSNDGTQVGTISVTGATTAYNTSSDYRLKYDDIPIANATERFKKLRPINFGWVANGERTDGFFSHEAGEVVPECSTGIKDAMKDEEYEVAPAVLDAEGVETEAAVMGTRSVPDYQGIDQSKLVPLMTATIHELITRIEALEGNV